MLANESSPALMQGGFDSVAAAYQSIGRELSAFRTGTGLAWGDHHPTLFEAIERFFRPGSRTRELFAKAGFGAFRRVAQTPVNAVYQASA